MDSSENRCGAFSYFSLNSCRKWSVSGMMKVFSGKDGAVLFAVAGSSAGEKLGLSVSGAGDVDLDGFDDFAVGSPDGLDSSGSDVGFVQIFSGKSGAALRTLYGFAAGGDFGNALDDAGDANQDGFPDLLIGAR